MHHTLRHQNKTSSSSTESAQEETVKTHHVLESLCHSGTTVMNVEDCEALLATALVMIPDCNGQHQHCRVFLDNGSNRHYITDSCVKRLGLSRKKYSTAISGLGGQSNLLGQHGVSLGFQCLLILMEVCRYMLKLLLYHG